MEERIRELDRHERLNFKSGKSQSIHPVKMQASYCGNITIYIFNIAIQVNVWHLTVVFITTPLTSTWYNVLRVVTVIHRHPNMAIRGVVETKTYGEFLKITTQQIAIKHSRDVSINVLKRLLSIGAFLSYKPWWLWQICGKYIHKLLTTAAL